MNLPIFLVLTFALLLLYVFREKLRNQEPYPVEQHNSQSKELRIEEQNKYLRYQNRRMLEDNNFLKRKIKDCTDDLDQSQATLSRYRFNLSHKIRVPIASLLGIINLVKHAPIDSLDNQLVIDMIEASSKKIDESLHEISIELNSNSTNDRS